MSRSNWPSLFPEGMPPNEINDHARELIADLNETELPKKTDGPASAVEDMIAVFDGITGKLLKDGGKAVASLATVEALTALTAVVTALAEQFTASASVPSGQLAYFAMSTAPTGWLVCDGTLYSRTTYADLFAAIGTTWGVGDGSTTFGVPYLLGHFLRSWTDEGALDLDRVFASFQGSQNLNHAHGIGQLTQAGDVGGYNVNLAKTGGPVSSGNSGGDEARPINTAVLLCIKA